MLAIRMQRTGRTGHAQFRVIVQDSRFSPTRGRVVAYAGSYDPHTKVSSLDTEVISSYLEKGAQPSGRVARLLKKEGVKLPHWVVFPEPKKSAIKNPEKLRRNRPPEAKTETPVAEAEVAGEEPKVEAEASTADVAPEVTAEAPTEEVANTEETAAPEEAETAAPSEAAPDQEEAKQA